MLPPEISIIMASCDCCSAKYQLDNILIASESLIFDRFTGFLNTKQHVCVLLIVQKIKEYLIISIQMEAYYETFKA